MLCTYVYGQKPMNVCNLLCVCVSVYLSMSMCVCVNKINLSVQIFKNDFIVILFYCFNKTMYNMKRACVVLAISNYAV